MNENMHCLKESQALLTFDQVDRLLYVMNEEMDVDGQGNFPTLRLSLNTLIKRIRTNLQSRGLKVNQVKMNGGAASYILASRDLPYTDIDLIFGGMDLSQSVHFDLVKDSVLEALIHFLPSTTNKNGISLSAMREAYVKKMVKVYDRDLWSLISLNNNNGRFIELKFLHQMRRQFQFSVDSFQIHLDSLMAFDEHSSPFRFPNNGQSKLDRENIGESKFKVETGINISANFYPSVIAESVYGNFQIALSHLNEMLIDTTEPELIKGGGLLKYCQLLSRGYRPMDPIQCQMWERYMCSRFFIDFPHVNQQQHKLQIYMDNHFRQDCQSKYDYLLQLYRVVDQSTVCLMNHERHLTLTMIDRLIYDCSVQIYYQEQNRQAMAAMVSTGFIITTQSSSPFTSSVHSYCSCGDTCQCSVTPISQRRLSSASESSSTPALEDTINPEQCQNGPVKQTLLYIPQDGSYWITVA